MLKFSYHCHNHYYDYLILLSYEFIKVISLVAGNLWRGNEVWGEANMRYVESDSVLSPSKLHLEIDHLHSSHELTYEDRLDSVNEFFESLFDSIDYSLLLIFLGITIWIDFS